MYQRKTVEDIKRGSEVVAERNREAAEEKAYEEFEKELTGGVIEETSAKKDDLEIGEEEYETVSYKDVEREVSSYNLNASVVDTNTSPDEVKTTVEDKKDEEEPTEIKIDDFDDLLHELEDDDYVSTDSDDDFENEEEDADEVRKRMVDAIRRLGLSYLSTNLTQPN